MSRERNAPINRGATLDWSWDWTDWLLPGDAIASRVVTPSAGLTVGSTTDATGVVTTVVTCDPAAPIGATLRLTCSITTAGGKTDSRSWLLTVDRG